MSSTQRIVAKISKSRRFSSSPSPSSSQTAREQLWVRRCRLLDASRGLMDCNSQSSTKKRPLPIFPLEARHFGGYDHQQHTAPDTQSSLAPNTPKEFHKRLCTMIRNAKKRVRIASLYVGPATSNKDDCEETEFLGALSEIVNRNHANGGVSGVNSGDENSRVSVKILLDENRALRPVPIVHPVDNDQANSKTTTSSAEAVARAIEGDSLSGKASSSSSLHLFRVLPPTTIFGRNWLPNPVDEIAGVFHIKIYIVDDQLLLSGANLSREYFCDRMDRYLHLVDGANGLVDFYAELVEILCRHSNKYQLSAAVSDDAIQQNRRRNNDEFLREITHHFQDSNPNSASVASTRDLFAREEKKQKIVAVAVPTFQAPAGYFRQKDAKKKSIAREFSVNWSTFWSLFRIDQQPADKVNFVTDIEATLNLLREAGRLNRTNDGCRYSVQLSSAYLNPTTSLLSVVKEGFRNVELLTAGKISHGFKPKKKDCKEGSQGTDWTIPSVFDKLVDECMRFLRTTIPATGADTKPICCTNARLFFWERPNWTFHAKGIWMTEKDREIESSESEVAAVVVGSSNFGYRSFCRDMESNLLLVFPPPTIDDGASPNNDKTLRIARSFGDEWKSLLSSSKPEVMDTDKNGAVRSEESAEQPPPLPWPILKSIPYIKSFF
ncbi:unnamed protein product [Pseudo-nitzschia multistriata]|uniref:CDP-diacylglycerol--glycerol-3-phosphate 3-phosphatidyltransferase n=1 Tax=Pseudo-nitzschia multistriata TaxID=183589 RepID=A0A448Z9Y7_9STRA|nr:unnamed protein product [Pseudo-nitzschia multistriata]